MVKHFMASIIGLVVLMSLPSRVRKQVAQRTRSGERPDGTRAAP